MELFPARPIHHLAMVATWEMNRLSKVATAARRWRSSLVAHPGASTIWRWWLREK